MKQFPLWVMVGVLGAVVVGAGVWITRRPAPESLPAAAVPTVLAPEAVAALGQLKPAGEVRRLAAPVSGFGGTPRIAALLVKEGERILKGQPLAIFDSRPQIEAEIAEVNAQIQSAELEVELQQREVSRYAAAAKVGAAAMVAYEGKQDELRRFQR